MFRSFSNLDSQPCAARFALMQCGGYYAAHAAIFY
jgi:hypothetical protein